jgi:AcrR family transcriptional regulator
VEHGYRRLSPGPGLSRGQVEEHQRTRIHRAMAELVALEGYRSVTVRKLAALAGVSTATFYAHFDGKEDCLAATSALLFERLRRQVGTSRNRCDDRRTQLTRTLEGLLGDVGSRSESHLVHVDSFDGGPASIGMIRDLETALELEVRTTLNRREDRVDAAAASWIVAGSLHLARMRELLTRDDDPDALAAGLLAWGLRYLGTATDEADRSSADVAWRSPIKAPSGDERSLLVFAVAKLTSSEGYWSLTVPKVRRAAGISRASFQRHFDGVEDCFLFAAEDLSNRFLSPLIEPDPDRPWREQITAAARMICESVSAEPALARLAFVDVLAVGIKGMRLREELTAREAATWRESLPRAVRPSELCAEATIAALRAAIARRLEAGEVSRLAHDAGIFAALLRATVGENDARTSPEAPAQAA